MSRSKSSHTSTNGVYETVGRQIASAVGGQSDAAAQAERGFGRRVAKWPSDGKTVTKDGDDSMKWTVTLESKKERSC